MVPLNPNKITMNFQFFQPCVDLQLGVLRSEALRPRAVAGSWRWDSNNVCFYACTYIYIYINAKVYVYVHIYVHMYIQQKLSIDLSQSNLQSFPNGRHQELCCEGKTVMASPNDGDAANKRKNIGMQQENKREFTNWRWKTQNLTMTWMYFKAETER